MDPGGVKEPLMKTKSRLKRTASSVVIGDGPDRLASHATVELLLNSLIVRSKVEDDEDLTAQSETQTIRKRVLSQENTEQDLIAGLDAAHQREQGRSDAAADKAKGKLVDAWREFEQNKGSDEERALHQACREATMLLDQGQHVNLPVNPFKGDAQTVVCFAILCLYSSVVLLFLVDQRSLQGHPIMWVALMFIVYAVVFKLGVMFFPNFQIHWSHSFYNYVRLRVSYFLLFNLVIVVSTFAGILIETFCAFITDAFPVAYTLGLSTKHWSRMFFFLLPDEIIFFSIYCEHCFKLALDTFDSPPLIGFQSSLLALLHKQPHPYEHDEHDEDDEDETRKRNWLVRKVDEHTHEHDKKHECVVKQSTCIIVDVVTVVVVEVLPILWAICGVIQYWGFSDRSHVGAGLRAYLWAGMACTMLMTGIYIFCNMVFAVRDRRAKLTDDDKVETRSFAETRECFDMALNRNSIFPGTLTFHHKECFDRHLFAKNILGNNSAAALETPPVPRVPGTGIPVDAIGHFLLLLIWGVVVHIGALMLHTPNPTHIQGACLGLGLMMVVTVGGGTYFMNMRFPGVIGKTYYGVNFFFLLVGASLFAAASLDITANPNPTLIVIDPDYSGWDQANSKIRPSHNWTGGPTSYPVCRINWGTHGAHLNALDVSQLAGIMYGGECSAIENSLEMVFPRIPSCNRTFGPDKSTWADCRDFHNCADYNTFPRLGVFDFYPPANHTDQRIARIVSLKGTSTPKDIYLDTTLWSTVKVLQAFATLLPVITIMPLDQVQWMIDGFHLPGERPAERAFWRNTTGIIEGFVEDNVHTVLTGHSLGGGVAQVVAARLGLPALVWSAPGMGYSARRFGIHQSGDWSANSAVAFWLGMEVTVDNNVTKEHAGVESSAHQTIVVMPQSDVVPRCDLQVGVVQPIECRVDNGQYGGALDCHSIDKTSCEIWRSCGDWPVRGRMINCSLIDDDEIGAWYKPDDI